MQLVRTAAEVRAALAAPRLVGLVPTMGALHAGHLSLVTRARAEVDVLVASIFVNPLQFGEGEDYAGYPRDLDSDLEQLGQAGVDVVFAPDVAAFTPSTRRTTVHVAALTERLEGASRPGHFDGVATIVAKLCNVVAPGRAYFGEKDFQQLAVIRRMAADLDMPVEVVACPVVRADDGVALSSRNVYLSRDERRDARALSAALFAVRDGYDGNATTASSRLRSTLLRAPGIRLDYAEVVDPETLEAVEGVVDGPVQALVAGYVGATRLIDTIRLEPPAA
jgi:pantoate--beta-alanine ligase